MPPGAPGEYTHLATGVPVKLASLGNRFLARLLDGLIIGVPMTIVMMIIVFAMAPSADEIARGETSGFGFAGFMLLMPVLMAIAYVIYETLMIGPRGQTLGKQVVGVKVVLATTGQVPGAGKAAGRSGVMFGPYAIPFIGGMYLLLCYLSPLFDSARRQGWHDKAAQTIAIATK
nr:RDD family protein [Haloechinothrix aidingensis]